MIQGNHEVKHSQLKWRPARIGTKQDWQDRLRNIRIGRKGVEEPDKVEDSIMAAPFFDENLYMMNVKSDPEPKARNFSHFQFLVLFFFLPFLWMRFFLLYRCQN